MLLNLLNSLRKRVGYYKCQYLFSDTAEISEWVFSLNRTHTVAKEYSQSCQGILINTNSLNDWPCLNSMPNRIKVVGITFKMDANKLNLTKKHKREQRTALKVAGVNENAPNGNMDIMNTARMNTADE